MAFEENKDEVFKQGDLPELLAQYYKRLFPYKEFYRWLSYANVDRTYFGKREFSFTLKDDVYIRYLSFDSQEEMEKEIQKRQPYKIDIGAVFTAKPRDYKAIHVGAFFAEEKELVFDIDMTDYDEVRTCCSGADICEKCWPLMTLAIRVLDRALAEDFNFKHRLWVYSGRRGVHCWVCDKQARKLSQAARSAVAEYLSLIKGGDNQIKKVNFGRSVHPSIKASLKFVTKYFTERFLHDQGILDTPDRWKKFLSIIPDEGIREKMDRTWSGHSEDVTSKEKWAELQKELNNSRNLSNGKNITDEIMCQYVYPRLDINVSKGLNHLLKSPFCVHPKTGKVCVPIDIKKLDEFDPLTVPTISTLCDEIDKYDKRAKAALEKGETIGDENSAPNAEIAEYKKTSLRDTMKLFQNFIMQIEVGEKKMDSKGQPRLLDW